MEYKQNLSDAEKSYWSEKVKKMHEAQLLIQYLLQKGEFR